MKSFGFIIVFLSLALVASSLEAGELFTLSNAAPDRELEWGKAFDRVEPVEFNLGALVKGAPYIQSEENSAEKLEIAIDGLRYSLKREFWEIRGHGNFSWFGKMEGAQFLSHFAVVDGAVAGEISLPLNTPFGFRRSILTREDRSYLIEWNDLVVAKMFSDDQLVSTRTQVAPPVSLSVGGRRRSVSHPSNCSGKNLRQTLDHLFVYGENVRTWFGKNADSQIQAFAQNGVDATNATTMNTTGGTNYWVNLVHVGLVDYQDAYLSGKWLSDDHKWVSFSTEVATLRNLYKADIVTLLVAGTTGGAGGLGSYPFSDMAGFSVVVVWVGAVAIAHETGHTAWWMGHPPEDWTNPDPVWATDHYVDGVFSGVMSTIATVKFCPKGCPTAWVWANPNVYIQGVPTGVLNERENWRALALMTPMISRFRISGNEEKCVASASFN